MGRLKRSIACPILSFQWDCNNSGFMPQLFQIPVAISKSDASSEAEGVPFEIFTGIKLGLMSNLHIVIIKNL